MAMEQCRLIINQEKEKIQQLDADAYELANKVEFHENIIHYLNFVAFSRRLLERTMRRAGRSQIMRSSLKRQKTNSNGITRSQSVSKATSMF